MNVKLHTVVLLLLIIGGNCRQHEIEEMENKKENIRDIKAEYDNDLSKDDDYNDYNDDDDDNDDDDNKNDDDDDDDDDDDEAMLTDSKSSVEQFMGNENKEGESIKSVTKSKIQSELNKPPSAKINLKDNLNKKRFEEKGKVNDNKESTEKDKDEKVKVEDKTNESSVVGIGDNDEDDEHDDIEESGDGKGNIEIKKKKENDDREKGKEDTNEKVKISVKVDEKKMAKKSKDEGSVVESGDDKDDEHGDGYEESGDGRGLKGNIEKNEKKSNNDKEEEGKEDKNKKIKKIDEKRKEVGSVIGSGDDEDDEDDKDDEHGDGYEKHGDGKDLKGNIGKNKKNGDKEEGKEYKKKNVKISDKINEKIDEKSKDVGSVIGSGDDEDDNDHGDRYEESENDNGRQGSVVKISEDESGASGDESGASGDRIGLKEEDGKSEEKKHGKKQKDDIKNQDGDNEGNLVELSGLGGDIQEHKVKNKDTKDKGNTKVQKNEDHQKENKGRKGTREEVINQVEQLSGGIEETDGMNGDFEAAIEKLKRKQKHENALHKDKEGSGGYGDNDEQSGKEDQSSKDEDQPSKEEDQPNKDHNKDKDESTEKTNKGAKEKDEGSTGSLDENADDLLLSGSGEDVKDKGSTGSLDENADDLLLSGSGEEVEDEEPEIIVNNENNAAEKDTSQVKKQNVKNLLEDLVPTGILPDVPEGFERLSDMSTVSFTYDVDENDQITVTSDIKEPLKLFDQKLTLSNTKMTFNYKDKKIGGQRWMFEAQATWINGKQYIEVVLESSKHNKHFTLTGEGESLDLKDYTAMFVSDEALVKSGMNLKSFDETILFKAEIYIVFKDERNIVSLVSGENYIFSGKPWIYKTYIQKFPRKPPAFSIMIDFQNTTSLSQLSSVMDDKLSNIPFVKDLINNKGALKVADGGFGFAASSADVDKLQLSVFGDGTLERQLGSHISTGVTLTLPIMIETSDDIKENDMAIKISQDQVQFFPSQNNDVVVSKLLNTLSKYTRPKLISLGYPDLSEITVKELTYDNNKLTYTLYGVSKNDFTLVPGTISLEDSTLELRQLVPDQFATLALFAQGSITMAATKLDVSVWTDSFNGHVLIEGKAGKLWTADISESLGVTMETDDDIKKILSDNHMLNMEIKKARMFTIVKDGESGSLHFIGTSRPALWNDPIEIEVVVSHDLKQNIKKMTVGYFFDKLPLSYAVDALSFNKFPSPRMLDNSRNTTLVLSSTDSDSKFVNQAMNGLTFKRGLTLVGQFRLPDVCSMNKQCEAASQLLGTEKWYRIQGLVSLRGFTLSGYVDKDFSLAKDLILKNNVMEFVFGNYSYIGISTALKLDDDKLTFNGYINFDNNGMRLRMSSNEMWSHPFPGGFVSFNRLQMNLPFVTGIPVNEFLVSGELNFGLPGSLYRIFAPAYLTFKTSDLKNVGFQATLSNTSMETIISALNFKSSLPDVLRNSRFPETLVMQYIPDNEKKELDFYGKLRMLERTMICKFKINDKIRILANTSHSKYPLILDNGLVMVYADKNNTKLGPRALFTIDTDKTNFKLDGYATFMTLGSNTDIEVSESGTQFSLDGNLFGLTKTVVSFMSPDGLTENGPYMASACIPEIIPRVISRVNYLVTMAADQANGYMKEAETNYRQANVYHDMALKKEEKYRKMLESKEDHIELDSRDLFVAEERYNRTCKQQHCDKTCIGCTAWRKCCDHDVFGNCVNCPGWKACCWRGTSPICKAKNHGCRIMKELAAENLNEVAKRVYKDKNEKDLNARKLWKSEYFKGKTQAVLNAASRALHLVNHDSQVGLGAAALLKKYGVERLINIQNVCFHTTLKSLATSCVGMRINATFSNKIGTKSLPYYGCLNREVIPKMAQHIINYMFPSKNVKQEKHKKVFSEKQKKKTKLPVFHRIQRWRRQNEEEEEEERPFWVFRDNHETLGRTLLQQRNQVPRSPLRKKWQIPASRAGKCKVYRQLMEICKDMMSTIQLMYRSYEEGKEQFLKRKTELELGLNSTIADLEKEASETPEVQKRFEDIEMNIRTVDEGVNQWRLNCETDQKKQNKEAIREWVQTMEGRITTLGGQGVERFLSNLFRAFEGMFLGTDTPKGNAEEVLNTLQSIREISATFHDIFSNNEISLEKANSRAEIVQAQLKHIRKTKIFCG